MASRTVWINMLSRRIYNGVVANMIFGYVSALVAMFLLGFLCGLIIGRNEYR